MDGPLAGESQAKTAMRLEYVKLVRDAEEKRQFDAKLSTVLADEEVAAFAHAVWLYVGGRIGFYNGVLEPLGHRCL